MAKRRPTRCKYCHTRDQPISARALCRPCAIERATFAARELQAHEGPSWEAWLAATRGALERL